MTDAIRFDEPKPTGAHQVAIQCLQDARRLMEDMKIQDGSGNNLTLAHVFDSQISAIIGSIDMQYKQVWHEVSTRALTVRVDEDGNIL